MPDVSLGAVLCEPGAVPRTAASTRLWICSGLFYPEDRSTGYFVSELARALASTERISVICSQPGYDMRRTRAASREVWSQVDIYRVWSSRFSKNGLFRRAVNDFTWCLSALLTIMRRTHPGDTILCLTNPPWLALIHATASRLRRTRFILLVHDVYPDALAAAGLISADGIIFRLLARGFAFLLSSAHAVIVLGRDMRDLVQRRWAIPALKVHIIPNWGDVDDIRPGAANISQLLHELNLSSKFVVQFSGNMGRTHGIAAILDAAALCAADSALHFLFIGTGALQPMIEQYCRNAGNATLLPYQPRERLNITLNACDIAVISLDKGLSGVSVPSRLYNILAAGKPVIAICEPESELAMVVREERVGWVVQPGDPVEFVSAIAAARDSESLQAMGRRARIAACTKYNLCRTVADFRAILRQEAS